jgi:peroxiredoxin
MSGGERAKTRFKGFKNLSPIFFAMLVFLTSSQIVHGSLAPDFTLTDIDGNTFSLSDFRGKVVILDFFATWCGKCRTEMSHLKTVNNELGSMIAIISLNVEVWISDETLRQFREDFGITWTVAKDTINVREMYGVIRTLELFIIDKEGSIQNHHAGVVVDASVLSEEILGIIPEFSSFLILPLFMIATLLAVIVCRRQLKKGNSNVSIRNF